ncbi:Mv-ORF21 peptide [Maruca vitrata nucleopolyhedrovirus]|uniref:Mv-ORF21 peptide n=1 Tax=Maruca vitrata nucleopolyhedrovirus TaxID=1307954 RepID=A1YR83_9ABAC|nr:Mv-ORF21 peptide [Maruca vitrata nucleopolyhedrovirus]ABL75973.1 Mv-ORF21 peptide [Maruca vitrata nucleopolyhedrovirus]
MQIAFMLFLNKIFHILFSEVDMAPTQALQRALKQKEYIKIIELAVKSLKNRHYLLDFQDNMFWKSISRECYGRVDFIYVFRNKLDWKIVSKSPLSITIANRFKLNLIWSLVSEQKFLTQDFILAFGDLLDMEEISKNYNNLSLSVQQKYAHRLNWKHIVTNHTLLKEWFQEPIKRYINYDYVCKYKHLNVALMNDARCMELVNLSVYMQDCVKISDALILYCLREGRVQELKAIADNIVWSDHMLVFDEYPGLANTLHSDWKCIDKWTAFNSPPAYYIKHMFVNSEFRNGFEENFNAQYWNKLINYTVITNVRASAAFNLMLFQNYKNRIDWTELQQCNQFLNLGVLYRAQFPRIDLQSIGRIDDETLWKAYGCHLKLNSDDCDDPQIIPLHMSVKTAYHKMILVEPCATQQEHDITETCSAIFKLNGGEEELLNWKLLSATQPICPFNLRHLQNVNINIYRNKNNHFVEDVYKQIIATQINM